MARRPFLISFSLYFLSIASSPLLKPKGSKTPPAQCAWDSSQSRATCPAEVCVAKPHEAPGSTERTETGNQWPEESGRTGVLKGGLHAGCR
jgi:hypothetical protein